jgi:hypothetical protein
MLIKEDEASTIRCCGPEGTGETRIRRDPERQYVTYRERYCIGAECMGWRWYGPAEDVVDSRPFIEGYCGRAGDLWRDT